jgi:hypothetical protein
MSTLSHASLSMLWSGKSLPVAPAWTSMPSDAARLEHFGAPWCRPRPGQESQSHKSGGQKTLTVKVQIPFRFTRPWSTRTGSRRDVAGTSVSSTCFCSMDTKRVRRLLCAGSLLGCNDPAYSVPYMCSFGQFSKMGCAVHHDAVVKALPFLGQTSYAACCICDQRHHSARRTARHHRIGSIRALKTPPWHTQLHRRRRAVAVARDGPRPNFLPSSAPLLSWCGTQRSLEHLGQARNFHGH